MSRIIRLGDVEQANAPLAHLIAKSGQPLIQGDSFFRELVDALPVAIYTTDADGRITYFNEAAAALWGYRPELGKSEWCGSWHLFSPDGRPLPHDQCAMAVALKEKRPIRGMDAVAERPDGSRVPFLPYPTPIFNGAGALIGAVNMLVDMTEWKRAENAALHFAAIVESSDDAVISKDLDGIVTSWNPGAERIFGYVTEEMIGRSIKTLIPQHLHSEEDAIIERIRSGQRIEHYETVRQRKDGSLVDISLTVSPIKNAHGAIVGASKIGRDITERKHTESAVLHFGAMVESADDAIISKDLNGIITSWNPGAERIFGYRGEEMIGKPIKTLIPQHLHSEEDTILARIRAGHRIEHYETVRQRKYGGLVDVSLTVSPIKNAQGVITGASKIARNISERKRSEAQIAMLAREAEHRVKNVLATVQATIHLTQADTPELLKQSIEGRIQALANVHALFVKSRWTGAELRSLVMQEILPYAEAGDSRVRVDGPALILETNTAQAIAVAVHELTTNAAKYGALSVPRGRVQIEWSHAAGDRLVLRWTETGGPPVEEPPTRKGFGTRVIQAMVQGQLKGEIRFDWRWEGLVCEIKVADDIARSSSA
jgi:PAS domain S-box-containing protein